MITLRVPKKGTRFLLCKPKEENKKYIRTSASADRWKTKLK